MRCCNVVLLIPLMLFGPTFAVAQSPNATSDLAANAAMKYWQAFAQMPTLDKDQEKLLGDWYKAPLDDAALKLIAASETSRLYLHRGAKLSRCDWSLNYEDGMGLLLPYLAKSRDLARHAGLHARHEFEKGHWDAGLEDVNAIMALARHVGNEPIMICILVRHLIEWVALDAVTPYLPELRERSSKLLAAYDALPAGATLSQAYLSEKEHFIKWLIRKLREDEQKQPGAWRDVLKIAAEAEGEEIVKRVGTYEKALQLIEAVLPVSDQMAKLVALPKAEFDRQYPEFKKQTEAANFLAGSLITSAEKVLASERRNQAQIALLRAAIAIVQNGEGQLKNFPDPFGDGPFEYRAMDKGFELKSKLLHQDKPVTMTVGRGK